MDKRSELVPSLERVLQAITPSFCIAGKPLILDHQEVFNHGRDLRIVFRLADSHRTYYYTFKGRRSPSANLADLERFILEEATIYDRREDAAASVQVEPVLGRRASHVQRRKVH